MTAEQLRDTTIEVLNGQVETNFSTEIQKLFLAARQGKFCYIFHNADFSCNPYFFYEYLARGGFIFYVKKHPAYGYAKSQILLEIAEANDVKVSWDII